MAYVPLHVHSVNSPFRGMMTPSEIVSRAAFLKMPAVALTDRWTTYGHHEFCAAAEKAGIRYILGAEIRHLSLSGGGSLHHLTVLSENEEGYSNLAALVGRHYNKDKMPHVTREEMELHREGLIVLTGCLNGEAAQAVMHGSLPRQRSVVEELMGIYGEKNVYLELMNHNSDKEQFMIDQMLQLSRKLGLPVVATNDDRFIEKDQWELYSTLRLLEGVEDDESEEMRREYYLKREKDMEPFFYIAPGALEESGRIAERCNVRFGGGRTMAFTDDPDPAGILKEMCSRRFLLDFHNLKSTDARSLEEELQGELASAEREDLAGFLLFLRKLILRCAGRGIMLELSGSDLLQSFICYLLEITPMNPLEKGLFFESFSSPRPGVPPPLEFMKSKGTREKLLEVLGQLLPGRRIFCQVVREENSLMTLIREIAQLMKLPEEVTVEMAGLASQVKGKVTVQTLLENSDRMTRTYNSDPAVRKVLHSAFGLRGRLHNFTLNTSRIMVLPRGSEERIAVMDTGADIPFAIADNAAVEWMGGCLFTVQRSHFLTALEATVRMLEEEHGRRDLPADMVPDSLVLWDPADLSDAATYGLISSGDTTGVYLMESRGVRDLLEKIKPADFDELVNVISLYRPAPLEGRLWQKYVENAEKKGKVFLPHHSMAAALENTRGLLLYREQVREILDHSAGISGIRAVRIENALKKKETGELLKARLDFIRGAMENDVDEEDAQKIFDFLLYNIEYTYDRAFSCCQAYISYRTAFLKAHYPDEYHAALLNATADIKDRNRKYIEYLESINKPVFPPDINNSGRYYSKVPGGIRAPLNEMSTLEPGEVEKIIAERSRGGEFNSLEDFLDRLAPEMPMVTVNHLIEGGLFDFQLKNHAELRQECLDFYGKNARAGDFFRPRGQSVKPKREEQKRQLSFFDDESGGPDA